MSENFLKAIGYPNVATATEEANPLVCGADQLANKLEQGLKKRKIGNVKAVI